MYIPGAKATKAQFRASSYYKNNAVGLVRDKILDKIPQRVIVLMLSSGVSNEANSMTQALLKEKLGSDYCRLQPMVGTGTIGRPDDTDPRLLDRYVAYAHRALEGNEAFIRQLNEIR